jgi:hypothetical protein
MPHLITAFTPIILCILLGYAIPDVKINFGGNSKDIALIAFPWAWTVIFIVSYIFCASHLMPTKPAITRAAKIATGFLLLGIIMLALRPHVGWKKL